MAVLGGATCMRNGRSRDVKEVAEVVKVAEVLLQRLRSQIWRDLVRAGVIYQRLCPFCHR